jgi:hypothetical protein
MLHLQKVTLGLIFASLFVSIVVPQVNADLSKTDEREVNNYPLTEKKLEQFGKATKTLIVLARKNVKIWQQPPQITDEAGGSLTKLAQDFDKIPGVKKAVEDAGMTSREYWVFHLAMIYGSTGHMILKSGGKLPEGYSRANIEFFGKHESAFMAVDKELKVLQELSQLAQGDYEEENDEDDQNDD